MPNRLAHYDDPDLTPLAAAERFAARHWAEPRELADINHSPDGAALLLFGVEGGRRRYAVVRTATGYAVEVEADHAES